MIDPTSQVDSQILGLKQAIERLEVRVTGLESAIEETVSSAAEPVGRGDPEVAEAGLLDWLDREPDPDEDPGRSISEMLEAAGANIGAGLIGGILLVLAGAFLLRSLTEQEILPATLGVVSGLAYAFVWVLAGHLLGKRGRRGAASASCIAACLVALPMILEATYRFELIGPWTAAGLLILVGVLLLPTAELHRLLPASTAAVLGIGCVALLLMFFTPEPEPFALTLVLLAVAAIWVGPRRGGLLPWFAYGFSHIGALVLIVGSLEEGIVISPSLALALLVGLFVATGVTIAIQTSKGADAGAHQIIHGILVTLLGFGGALLIAEEHLPDVATVLAAVGMTIGIASYAYLIFNFEWSRGHLWAFLLYSSLGLGLVAMGSWVLLPQPAWLFTGLAALLAAVGVRLNRVSPGLHAAMAITIAAVAGAFGGLVLYALAARGSAAWPAITPEGAVTLAVAVLCAALPLKAKSPLWPDWLPRLGRAVVILVAVLGVDALLIYLAAPVLAGEASDFEPGSLAALRTAVLATSVVLLAGLSRIPRMRPAQGLVWPLLALIALKLAVEDFPRGQALTMAVALLIYGVALILSARLLSTAREHAALAAAG